MADFISELRERRVLPAVGVYVASCWVVVEILDRLVERYLLSPYLTDLVFWGLFTLIPAVLLLAWTYGRPGKDKATRGQVFGVILNVLATTVLLFTLFGGKDMGVTAQVVSVANEEGEQETHIIPSESYRRRLAVFFYENESDDPALDWLQYAATELLTQDLQQDPFLLASSPYNSWGGGFYGRLKAAGFDDGVGAPASLLRDIAQDANRQTFIEGSVTREGEELVLTTRVWDAGGMTQIAEISQQGWDLYEMMDETSRQIRKALEVPSVGVQGHEDLPLAETYGESQDALKAYISGLNARLFDSDVAGAIGGMDQALAIDPNFVLALFIKGVMLVESGNMPAAAEVLAQAQKLDYRLPANDRATLKGMYYRTTGQSQKLMDFLRLQVRLRDDSQSHTQLANLLMVNGEIDEAERHFEQALARDSLNTGLYLVLSDISRSRGDMEAAIEDARRYQQARPGDMEASLKLGDLLRDSGALDEAQTHYEQAQLIEDDTVSPLLRLHIIAARKGDDALARSLLEQALEIAETANQLSAVHLAAHYYESRLGRMEAAIGQLRAAEPYFAQSQPPFVVALSIHSTIITLHLRQGDIASAKAVLEEARGVVTEPPLNQFLAPMEVVIAAAEEDYEAAQGHLARFEAVLEQLNFKGLDFQVPMVAAEITGHQERYGETADLLAEGIEKIDRSFIAGELYAYGLALILSQQAESEVLAGRLESAEDTLARGFALDPTLPNLWVAQARLQHARGEDDLASASVDRALSSWAQADAAFLDLQRARELADQVSAGDA